MHNRWKGVATLWSVFYSWQSEGETINYEFERCVWRCKDVHIIVSVVGNKAELKFIHETEGLEVLTQCSMSEADHLMAGRIGAILVTCES